jgi:hypothetical protein
VPKSRPWKWQQYLSIKIYIRDEIKSILKNYPSTRPWRPIVLWDVKTPTFSRQLAHSWQWGCQSYVLGTLYPQEDSVQNLFTFLSLIWNLKIAMYKTILWTVLSICASYPKHRAITQLRQLVAGFPPQQPRFEPRSGHVGLVVDKVALGLFSLSTSVSSANSHSTNCSTLIILCHTVLVQ